MPDLGIVSPGMLKLFSECEAKWYYRYIEQIPAPKLDKSFITGKNIHALASYYLRGEKIDKFEKCLTEKENGYWTYLKSSGYLKNGIIGVEKNISCRLGKYWIGGRIDAVVKNGDELSILDYKTGGVSDDMVYDYQTMVYLLLCERAYKDFSKLSFIYLDLKNKKEVRITLSDSLKKEYEDKVIEACDKMACFKIESFVRSNDCLCEYSKICTGG